MNFDFSAEQQELRSHLAKVLDQECSLEAVREVYDCRDPEQRQVISTRLMNTLAELGYAGICIPEHYGGMGLGALELCVVAEELGCRVAPLAYSSSIYIVAQALLRYGSDEQKARYLPALATGELNAALASFEAAGECIPVLPATRSVKGVISGIKTPVLDGLGADLLLVSALSDAGVPGFYLVDARDSSAAYVSREALASMDPSRSLAKITLQQAPAEFLCSGDQMQAVIDCAAVPWAFEMLGMAEAALQMGRDYALQRYAFGRPIGSFQAVKYRLVDIYARNEIARSNAYYAAWALASSERDLPAAAACAYISAAEAATFAGRENNIVHGGISFTWEADCQFYFKRSRLMAQGLGSSLHWKERLVRQMEAA